MSILIDGYRFHSHTRVGLGMSHNQALPIKAHMFLSASQEDVGMILLGVVSVASVPTTVGQVDDGGAIPVADLWRGSHVTQILQSNWTEW